MWGIKTVIVSEHERALLFRDGDFVRVLMPGRHRLVSLWPLQRVEVEVFDLTSPEFEHERGDFLVRAHPELRGVHFDVVETSEREVAVVRIDGQVKHVVEPADRRIFWRSVHQLDVERFDIGTEFALGAEAASLVRQLSIFDLKALGRSILF